MKNRGHKVIKYKNGLQRKIDRAAAITTISDFTKKEVFQISKDQRSLGHNDP